MIDLTALQAYILDDPDTLGLAALVALGSASDLADALNMPQAGAGFVIPVKTVPWPVILGAISRTEFSGTGQPALLRLAVLTRIDPFPLGNTALKNLLKDCTGPTGDAALDTLSLKQGSAIEKLFGPDEKVSWQQVAEALAL
jgi:hypothetical protein